MIQSFTQMLPSVSTLLPTLGKNVLSTLVMIFTCAVLGWYAQYHWKRRKLYQLAAQRKGPSTLPLIGSALHFLGSTSDIMDNLLRLATEFESPVPLWLGQDLYFIITKPNDLEIILNSPYALQKSHLYRFTATGLGDGLLTAAVPKWRKHRRIINPTFSGKIVGEFVEKFSEQSEILVEQLAKQSGKGTFDIFDYISPCSLDILCETALGITINAQTTTADYYKWLNVGMEVIFRRMVGIFYHPDFIFNLTPMSRQLYENVNKMDAFTATVLKDTRSAYRKKLKESRERPDAPVEEERKGKPFLQKLIELSEQGEELTDEEINDELKNLMVGGSHSTSSTECFLFIMLGMYPDIQQKVYEEVIDVLGPDRPVEFKDLEKFKYLQRVIDETLRLFPVGPVIGRDVTQDIKLDSCTIPAGSSAIISIISMHRDPSVWPNPFKFDPDRFLPEEVAKRSSYCFAPFSKGPRNCVGLKFASMAMKVLIPTVVRKYQFFSDYKTIEEIKLKAAVFLKPADGFPVSLKLRE